MPLGQLCLKRDDHTQSMLKDFENFLSTEEFVDVTLACDGLSLKAHKIVLSACSPYFQSLFLENPCKHPIVIMKDINYKDLQVIISYMYHGEVNVSKDQISDILKASEALKVKGLAGAIHQILTGFVQLVSTPVPVNTCVDSTPVPVCVPVNTCVDSTPVPVCVPVNTCVDSTPVPVYVPVNTCVDSTPVPRKRKRSRRRKRSLSDSNRSDDAMVPINLQQCANQNQGGMLWQGSKPSQGPMHSSVNAFSLKEMEIEPPSFGEVNEVEPFNLVKRTFLMDNVPSMSNAAPSGNFILPSSSGMGIMIAMSGNNQALVPVSGTSDSLSSSHLQGPDTPKDKPPSPSVGASQSIVYMDQSSLPGPSSYRNNSLVQPQAFHEHATKQSITFDEWKKAKNTNKEPTGPIADGMCSNCGHEVRSYAALQTRSADEGQTILYICPECQYGEHENC